MRRTNCSLRFLTLCVAFASGLFPLAGQDSARVRFLPCTFTDGSDSPYFRTRLLAQRLLREAEQLFPPQPGALDVALDARRFGKDPEYSIEMRRGRKTLSIRLPVDDEASLELKAFRFRAFAARILLARLGLSPERAPELMNHWIVRAIIRSTIRHASQSALPIAKEFPGSYALASHGICPPARAAARTGAWDQGAPAALNDEYAELLLHAILRNSKGGSERIVRILRNDLSPARAAEPLEAALGFSSESECDEWFRRNVESTLLNSFSPASSELVELRYREARVWRGKNDEDKEVVLTIPDLAGTEDDAPPQDAVTEILTRLNELVRIASSQTAAPLAILRAMVARCGENADDPPSRRELEIAERHVFDALNSDQALLGALAICEIRNLPPALRFPYSMQELRWSREQDAPEPKKLRECLDRWDEFR